MKILISVHVPKTGGTSFRSVLEQFYGSGFWTDYDWEDRPSVIAGPALNGEDDEIREALSSVRCIHGHFNVRKYLRLRDIDGIDPVFITWLRDPVERALSAYYFLRNLNSTIVETPEWERLARSMSLYEYFSSTSYGSNQQARQLQALPIEDYDFIGCTELYDESICVFSEKYLSGEKIEAVPHKLKNQERTKKSYDVPEEVRELLNAQNDLDFRLCDYGRGWLAGAFSMLEGRASPRKD